MLGKIITNLVIWLMRSSRFSLENRNKCITALLDKLYLVPHKDIIKVDRQGRLIVKGRALDLPKATNLREGAKAMLDNQTRDIVREQIAFKAVTMGVHKCDTPEEMYWSKVALWIYQQEDELYKELAVE